MVVGAVTSLPQVWRSRAADPWLPEEVRQAFLTCAEEREAELRDEENALLSPKQAAMECGLQPATIRKKLSKGELPNEGNPGRPKVRRGALRRALAGDVARRLEIMR